MCTVAHVAVSKHQATRSMHTVAVVSAPAFGKNVCPIEEQECAMRKIRRGSRVVRSMACTANSWVSGIVDEIHDGTFSFQHALLHLSWGPSGQLPLPYSLHSTKSWGKGSSSTTVLSHSVKSPVASVDAAAPAHGRRTHLRRAVHGLHAWHPSRTAMHAPATHVPALQNRLNREVSDLAGVS